jgi:hypothetical protein
LALFLAHHVEGCMEVLKEIDDDQHPLVVKTRSAVERWRRSLGLLQRFLLLCGMQMEGRAIHSMSHRGSLKQRPPRSRPWLLPCKRAGPRRPYAFGASVAPHAKSPCAIVRRGG